MAVVKITDKIKLEIQKNIAAPFSERYKTAAIVSAEDAKHLYDTLFVTPDQWGHLDKLPASWVSISHSQNLQRPIFIGHKNGGPDVDKHWLQLGPFNDPRYYTYSWLNTASDHSPRGVETHYSSWLKADLKSAGLSKDYITPLETICKERDAALATVDKMLDGCATLNQVEKIWPAIRKYVSAETLKRLDHKPERKTRESVGIDASELQSLSVHHIKMQMTS